MKERVALALRIRKTREKLHLSQDEFAQQMGCCKSSVINYESGKRVPGAGFLIDLVKNFGINPDWLLTGNGEIAAPLSSLNLKEKKDLDLQHMLEHLQIPTMKLSIMAEYHRLKQVFKPLIDEFEQLRENNKKLRS